MVERSPVVNIEQVETERLGGGLLQNIAHEDHVAVRLRHLLSAETHLPDVHPMTDEPLPQAMGCLALRDLAFVMRVDEIAATAVNVDGKPKVPVDHRRTLEVPARATTAERARPRGAVAK